MAATKLEKRRAEYHAALARADKTREAFVAEIIVQCDSGRSMANIARELGLTRARVQQLVKQHTAKGNHR